MHADAIDASRCFVRRGAQVAAQRPSSAIAGLEPDFDDCVLEGSRLSGLQSPFMYGQKGPVPDSRNADRLIDALRRTGCSEVLDWVGTMPCWACRLR